MPDLPITLCTAAAAALLNIWLAMRCGQARMKAKVSIGDGGDSWLIKRMRAHANFTEFTPFALILILMLELAGQGGTLLALSAAIYILSRICHMFGMEADEPSKLRMFGIMGTMVLLLVWSIAAVLVAAGLI